MKPASHWLDQPGNHKILWAGFIIVLIATLVLEWIWPIHAHFSADDLFGFNALYGFLVCAAMIAFASFHLLNVAGGVPPAAAAFQVVFTLLAGAIFLQAAVGSGSLWPAMIVHAVYDAVTFDLERFRSLSLSPRQAQVRVNDLAAFFPFGVEPVWTIRALTGEEIARHRGRRSERLECLANRGRPAKSPGQ
jgi:hypothetical protein